MGRMSDDQAPDFLDVHPRVMTIGHSTREFDEVVRMLHENEVDLLVDVRSYPSSRKHPQWYKDAIRENLPSDIAYTWMGPQIGGRRHTPAGVESVNGGWRVKAFRDYADYMATDEFRAGIDELVALTAGHVPAIMCSEAVPWRCHRRLITDALLQRGMPVFDIMSETKTEPASMTEFVREVDGILTYPASPDETLPGT